MSEWLKEFRERGKCLKEDIFQLVIGKDAIRFCWLHIMHTKSNLINLMAYKG